MRALFGLALLYQPGEAGGQDAAAAYGWRRRAVEAGKVLAEFSLGLMRDRARNPPKVVVPVTGDCVLP
jgi:hypothetical protein